MTEGLRTLNSRRVVLVRDAAMGRPAITGILADACRSAGENVATAALNDLAQKAWWDRIDAGIIALPNAHRLPAAARDGLLAFLGRGGKLLCAGAPLMGEPLFRVGDTWLTARDLAAKRQALHTEHPLATGEGSEAYRWPRSSNNPRAPSRLAVRPTAHGPALRLEVKDLQGWDNFGRSFRASPFLDADSLTCFWARGERATDALSVEWQEQDGSRWIATVPITRAWRHYVLLPRDFVYWPDNPMGRRRGGAGDQFHPERAARLILGFAASHGAGPGDHAAWIADLGTAADPFGGVDTGFAPPQLAALSPAYELYPIRAAGALQWTGLSRESAKGRQREAEKLFRVPADGMAPIPRQPGIGLAERPYRFVPLIRARDAAGQDRGALAWEVLHPGKPHPGAAWVVIGTSDEAFWSAHRAALSAFLAPVIHRLEQGVFLAAGGADRFTSYTGEAVTIGARVANLGDRKAAVRVSVRLVGPSRMNHALSGLRREQTLTLAPLQTETVHWQLPPLPTAQYQVRVAASGDSPGAGDALSHSLVVTPPPQVRDADAITARKGHFWLHGRRWFALGVNFWPRYAVGTELDDDRRHWLDPVWYDPTVVEEDLRRVRAIGMNCVSLQYTSPEQAMPLRDVLRRCQEHGLRVNLYVAGAHPLQFDPARVRRLMEAADLSHQPALFAYDVAWEPVWGRQEERRRFDADWRVWLSHRYGRSERAEAAWGVAANRDSQGQITGPTDDQVTRDGPWRRMVADYRRFQDDELNERYAAVRKLIRSIDPHHLIGARTGWGGGPFVNEPAMPFDHSSGAAQLDFISPEGWNLRGAESIQHGAFIPAYDRMVSGGKPVFWAEFGDNCGYPLGGITGAGDPAQAQSRLHQQAGYYDRFYRLVRLSDSDGAMAWWLPGGYRVDERSDFGIINPDGTVRPAGEVAKRYSGLLSPMTPASGPETWLTVDRFADARGAWALWQKEAGEFARLLQQGHRVGLRPASRR